MISLRTWLDVNRTPLFAICLLCLLSGSAAAQTPLGPVPATPVRGLLELPSNVVVVRYSTGALDRAARLQSRLEEVYGLLAGWGRLGRPFSVLVLSPEDWRALGLAQPYGVPVRVNDFSLAVAAWGNPETVALWRNLLGGPVPPVRDFSARGSGEEVATLHLADALLEFELCRTFVRVHDLASAAEGPWLSDLLAHVACAGAEDLRAEPVAVPLRAALAVVLAAQAQNEPTPPDLAAYSSTLEPVAWMRYQAHFIRGAQQIWHRTAKQGIKKMLRLRRRAEHPLTFAELEKPFPELGPWRRGAPPAPAP